MGAEDKRSRLGKGSGAVGAIPRPHRVGGPIRRSQSQGSIGGVVRWGRRNGNHRDFIQVFRHEVASENRVIDVDVVGPPRPLAVHIDVIKSDR